MLRKWLFDAVTSRVLPKVQKPARYMGGELNAVRKDHRSVRGLVCLAFPDAYELGMSHHGLQILYTLMNDRDWACERAFAPLPDCEQLLRRYRLPLYSLETFTPLCEFDVVGFSLQYEICYTNLLTMLDLGGIPLHVDERGWDDPLIIVGGPCAQNVEPLAPFVDAAVIGDGEPALPALCERWLEIRQELGAPPRRRRYERPEETPPWVSPRPVSDEERAWRREALARLAASFDWLYVPSLYEVEYNDDGTIRAMHPTRPNLPAVIMPSIVSDLDEVPLVTRPIVPFLSVTHDRISFEIMRGCPWNCRFCQSTVIKRPLRVRSVDSLVNAALEAYRNTGLDEIGLLSLSSSDYPYFEELVSKMAEVFRPLGVNVSVPSLRVNDQFRSLPKLMAGVKRGGLTLAPEVARDDMREQIRKRIKNENLYEGCRQAFREGWQRVKLYFMCGLPGERPVDLDGIVEMAETVARIGKEEMGRYPTVTASVSNFVPKPHTPYQWNAMARREYFEWAHRYLIRRKQLRCVRIKCHDIDTSLLEGILTRGDRRVAPAVELAWRRGARFDAWTEYFRPELWWQAFEDCGIDFDFFVHRERPLDEFLPWDNVKVKKGRTFLEREQQRARVQLATMAEAANVSR